MHLPSIKARTRLSSYPDRTPLLAEISVPFVRPTECNLARDGARSGHIARRSAASANRLRQHGHSPSNLWASAENAMGCGSAMIA
jgi:hypothetical protein